MHREERIRRVAHLLTMALNAYSSCRAKIRDREMDDQWPEWVAEYLIGHGLDVVLDNELAVERLSRFLLEVGESGNRDDGPWLEPPAAARLMVEVLA